MATDTTPQTATPSAGPQWIASWRVNMQGIKKDYAVPCPAQGIAAYNPTSTPITVYMYQDGPSETGTEQASSFVVGAKRFKSMPVEPFNYIEIVPAGVITSSNVPIISAYDYITPADVALDKVSSPDLWLDDDLFNPTEDVTYESPSGGIITVKAGAIDLHLRIATGFIGALTIEPITNGTPGSTSPVTIDLGHNVQLGQTGSPPTALVLNSPSGLVMQLGDNASISEGNWTDPTGAIIMGKGASLTATSGATIGSTVIHLGTGSAVTFTADIDISSSLIETGEAATLSIGNGISSSEIRAGKGSDVQISGNITSSHITGGHGAYIVSAEAFDSGNLVVEDAAYYDSSLTAGSANWYNTTIHLKGGAELTLGAASSFYVYGGRVLLEEGAYIRINATSAGIGVEALALTAGAGSSGTIYLGDAYGYQVIRINPAQTCDLGSSTTAFTGSFGSDPPVVIATIPYSSLTAATVLKYLNVWLRDAKTRWLMLASTLNQTTGDIKVSPYDSKVDTELGSPASPVVGQSIDAGTIATNASAVVTSEGTILGAGDSLVLTVAAPTTAPTSGNLYVLAYQNLVGA